MKFRVVLLLGALAIGMGEARADHRSLGFSATLRGHLGHSRFHLRFGRFHHRHGFRHGFFAPVVVPTPFFGCPPPYYYPPYPPPFYSRYEPGPLVLVLDSARSAPVPYAAPRPEQPAPAPEGELSRSGLERLRRDLVVEEAEPGAYFVRWRDPAPGVLKAEYEVQDGDRKPLSTRIAVEAPFRALIRLPESAASVLITAYYRDGSSVSLRVPIAEFKRLGGTREPGADAEKPAPARPEAAAKR